MARLTTSLLVDRARVVRKVSAGPKIEGQAYSSRTHLAWMPARMIPAAAPEGDDQHAHRRVLATAQILLPADADVLASDELEVESAVGAGAWQVVGQPEPLRGRSKVIGVAVPVRRVLEPTREDVE